MIFGCEVIAAPTFGPVPWTMLSTPGRQTGFATNFAKQIRRHRRELAWLRDRGITDGKRGRNFPAQQVERQVPRRNQADDSARLAQRVVEGDAIRDVRLVFRMQNRGSEKAKIGNRARNLEHLCERNRFAGIDRFGAREFCQIALDQIGNAKNDPRALLGRCARPVAECLVGRGHSELHIAEIAVGNVRVGFARCRLDVLQILPAGRANEIAADEVRDLKRLIMHGMFRFGYGYKLT